MTAFRIIRIHVCVSCVAVATIQGRDHYGICKTFAVAAAATAYREGENLTSREMKARSSLHFCSTKKCLRLNPLQRMI